MKKYWYIKLFFALIFVVNTTSGVAQQNTISNELLHLIIDFGKTYEGKPYQYGGCSSQSKGFDCSGFMHYIFKMGGVKLPRRASEIAQEGKKVAVHRLRKGDLLFFNTSKGKRISHIGIVAEILPNKIIMLHSSSSKGIEQVNIKTSDYWWNRLLFSKRLTNFVAKTIQNKK